MDENAKAEKRGGRPALTQPVLLGITKASLQTKLLHLGGLLPGDYPRAYRRLGATAKTDTLEGLKENVIVGRLIPAGTGSYLRGLQRLAAQRDEALVAQRQDTLVQAPPEAFPVELEQAMAEDAPAE